jgi:hypothetical protein
MVARSRIHVEHVRVPAVQAFSPASLEYFEKSLEACAARGVRVGAVVSTRLEWGDLSCPQCEAGSAKKPKAESMYQWFSSPLAHCGTISISRLSL